MFIAIHDVLSPFFFASPIIIYSNAVIVFAHIPINPYVYTVRFAPLYLVASFARETTAICYLTVNRYLVPLFLRKNKSDLATRNANDTDLRALRTQFGINVKKNISETHGSNGSNPLVK